MSRKALLVGLEYPLDNERRLESSVNDILEFNQCLTQNLNFLPENIEILVDASATVGGQKPFDFNQVKAKLNTLVCNAKEGDVLLFVFSGHGLVRTPCLYLGCNEQGNKVYMNAKDFEDILDQLKAKPNPNKLYMFIGCCGSGGLLQRFGFTDQLRNHDNQPLVKYPFVTAFMATRQRMGSKNTFNYTWLCPCSNFLYVVVRAIETDSDVSNLELGQFIDLVLVEIESLLTLIRVERINQLREDNEHEKIERLGKLNKYVQRPVLLCTEDQSRVLFLSN
jgi:hypothetical protein